MKAILVMFDSLNRSMLSPYGCGWIDTPNFERLARRSVMFDRCYVGSMPCMPARRELHTGRYNFLHRGWGPLEPFDDSVPEMLKQAGVHTHLVSDHYHYWEDGGATYHSRYSTWECIRGQEGDLWKGQVRPPARPETLGIWCTQDEVNRAWLQTEKDWPQARTFAQGLDFLKRNHKADNWFLQIETFDPHEPFCAAPRFREKRADGYDGPRFDWPDYTRVRETPQQVEHLRNEYAALVEQCDANLGLVLDAMDQYDLWGDTLLIVNTDHGFLLGEHGLWAKSVHPFYEEVAHIPLFVWDPRYGNAGQRRKALVQTVDLAPTLLDAFDLPPTERMQGVPLQNVLQRDEPIRASALFGIHGGQACLTDGRYVLMRAPVRQSPLFEYTLMPCHMQGFFSAQALAKAELVSPFSFTQGCPLLKVPARSKLDESDNPDVWKDLLFDLERDPCQQAPLQNAGITRRFLRQLAFHLHQNEAPPELYARWRIELYDTGSAV